MRYSYFSACLLVSLATAAAQDRAIVAQPKVDPSARQFATVLRQALGALAESGSYAVDVESQWGAPADPTGPQGGGRYRLTAQAGKYRVEMRSQGGQAPELVCVNDGSQVTTYFPGRKLYSQHASDSPQAGLEYNKMLALSLQGSALDILLQRDVAGFVQTQASGVQDHGESLLAGTRVRRFEVVWAGAKVELSFAAEGVPLLLQFVRTTSVPTGMNQHYEMVCTAKFQWQLGARPAAETFVVQLPAGVQRVNEIYDALSGDDAATRLGKPLPKIQLSTLDGNDIELQAAPDKKATVLIFWATWCAASLEDLPSVHKFVAENKDRGVAFYAVNVGEPPGEVRRFTAKHPLVSTVLLDPHGKATSALRVNELPAIAIIKPDGTVQTILHGQAKELQGELASQLNSLLSGGADTTARRPAEKLRSK